MIEELHNTVEKLKAEVAIRDELLLQKEREIGQLLEDLKSLRRNVFAPKSEKVPAQQLGLFNELEEVAKSHSEDDDEEIEVKGHKRKKRRPRIPDDIPREEITIELPPEQRRCSEHDCEMEEFGEEVSEKVEIVPAQVKVKKTIRKKYRCPCCEGNFKTAPSPTELLPKTMASASMIAYIPVAKFADALPLYRQETIFNRIGFELSRQSMARWLIEIYQMLVPLYNLLQDELLARDYVQMDETTTQVLKEEGRRAQSKSYMWVRYAPVLFPIVLYDYFPSRAGDIPVKLLEGFKGALQCDGYIGYAKVVGENCLKRLGCMDHCRRKFVQAFKTSHGKGIGKTALIYLKKLYKIEKKIADKTPDEIKSIRNSDSRPILEEMKNWLDQIVPNVLPSSKAGEAVLYARNEWSALTKYLDEGRYNISNAWVENIIRPFVLGRKNWLFSDSVDGAHASALFFSLIETAKANGLEPFDYLLKVLEKLPHAQTVEGYQRLLPLANEFLAE